MGLTESNASLQSTAARHIRSVTASLPQSPQDTSLQALLPVTMLLCLRSDIVVFGHVNRFSYFSLTTGFLTNVTCGLLPRNRDKLCAQHS